MGSLRAYMLTLAAAGLLGLCSGQGCMQPPPAVNVIPAEQARTALASQCALNVIECTGSWPTADIQVIAGPGQTLTRTDAGFLVQGSDGDGVETVRLTGSGSTAGRGAGQIFFSWSTGSTDGDIRTLSAGTEFSNLVSPAPQMAVGFHYVRLTVTNDIFRQQVPGFGQFESLGVVHENVFSFDFIEVEIEVRD